MAKWAKTLVRLSMLALVLVCGYVSYWHQVELCEAHGEGRVASHLIPVVADALMIIASLKVYERRNCMWRKRVFPSAVMYLGLIVSLVVNGVTADLHDPIAMGVSAWPALGLWCAVELLVRPVVVSGSSSTRSRQPAKKTAPAKTQTGTVKAPRKAAAPRKARAASGVQGEPAMA
jgi:hypothetical protein